MAKMMTKSAFVWHAFNALTEPNSQEVKKAKLKVLTHSIATALEFTLDEKKIENYENDSFTFASFMAFFQTEVINNVTEPSDKKRSMSSLLERVDEVCWMLCSKSYTKRVPPIIDDECTYILWKIFNTLSEPGEDGLARIPVVVDHEEAEFFFKQFCDFHSTTFDTSEFRRESNNTHLFSFAHFLNYFETHLCTDSIDPSTIHIALKDLQDKIIYEVIKKGMLVKKGAMISSLKERWFVLTPTLLRYYTSSEQAELKGEFTINPLCKIEVLSDATKGSHRHRFKLLTAGKGLEMFAADVRTRAEWQTAVRTAVEYCKKAKTPQEIAREERYADRQKRRLEQKRKDMERKKSIDGMLEAQRLFAEEKLKREEAEKLAEEERLRRLQEEQAVKEAKDQLEAIKKAMEEIKARVRLEEERWQEENKKVLDHEEQLQLEKQARQEIEQHLQDVEAHHEEDKRAMLNLIELKEKLEVSLEEERQAKRDEEIVRSLQARVLLEEEEKRKKLEEMQEELSVLLEMEQSKRVGLEDERRHQEEALRLEKERMEILQLEKKMIAQDLEDKTVKLAEAEQAKLMMEEKFKKKDKEKPAIVARLAAHLPDKDEFEIVTHRGLGAFVKSEFLRRDRSIDTDQDGGGTDQTAEQAENDPTDGPSTSETEVFTGQYVVQEASDGGDTNVSLEFALEQLVTNPVDVVEEMSDLDDNEGKEEDLSDEGVGSADDTDRTDTSDVVCDLKEKFD